MSSIRCEEAGERTHGIVLEERRAQFDYLRHGRCDFSGTLENEGLEGLGGESVSIRVRSPTDVPVELLRAAHHLRLWKP